MRRRRTASSSHTHTCCDVCVGRRTHISMTVALVVVRAIDDATTPSFLRSFPSLPFHEQTEKNTRRLETTRLARVAHRRLVDPPAVDHDLARRAADRAAEERLLEVGDHGAAAAHMASLVPDSCPLKPCRQPPVSRRQAWGQRAPWGQRARARLQRVTIPLTATSVSISRARVPRRGGVVHVAVVVVATPGGGSRWGGGGDSRLARHGETRSVRHARACVPTTAASDATVTRTHTHTLPETMTRPTRRRGAAIRSVKWCVSRACVCPPRKFWRDRDTHTHAASARDDDTSDAAAGGAPGPGRGRASRARASG